MTNLTSTASTGPRLGRRSLLGVGAVLAASGLSSGSAGAQAAQTGAPAAAAGAGVGQRRLGSLSVSPIGLGCMSMVAGTYNPTPDRAEMVRVIHEAHDLGVNFIDTAETYGPFGSERVVGEALQPIRQNVVLATKFGFTHADNRQTGRSSKPADIRKAVEGSLGRLRTDHIDLLYLHRMDPQTPIADIAGTVGDLIREGKVREFGVSELNPDTLRAAHAVTPVAAVQNEYSLFERLPEVAMLQTCEELGIGFVPWSPTMRALLADNFNAYSRFSEDDRRSSVPFFTPQALEANLKVVGLVRTWADRKGVTPVQFSLAWLMAQKPFVVPIPGSTRLHHIRENLGAASVTFTPEELAAFRTELEALPIVGARPRSAAFENM